MSVSRGCSCKPIGQAVRSRSTRRASALTVTSIERWRGVIVGGGAVRAAAGYEIVVVPCRVDSQP